MAGNEEIISVELLEHITKIVNENIQSEIKKTSEDLTKTMNEKIELASERLIKDIKENIFSEIKKISFDLAGDYEWTVPEGVHQILVTASAGGASGEGIDHNLNTVSEDGEDTLVNSLTIKGGTAGMIPPKDSYTNKQYLGGEGESSPFGKGGSIAQGEAEWTLDGEKGSGGMGATNELGSGFGGGAGGFIIDHAISVIPGQKIKIKVGKGGMRADKNAYLHPAGRGGDGFVNIRCIEIKIDLQPKD